MIIDSVKHSDVTTNISSDDVTPMTVSADGMEHIMNLLTNLYKDPELAVIREYFTNAVDAHVAVGQTLPVQVTLPTWDSPMYVVQDFGIGMSTEDIKNIYAQYGASTKRKSNDQVGAFGLGCKSALTTADQFTVISVKNSIKSTVLISKTESGVNTVNIVNVTETPEPNGTTIKIPIPNESSFNSKANKFFNYCDPSVVLIDGKAPTGLEVNWTTIEDPTPSGHTVRYNHDKYVGTFLSMGNVPYQLDRDEIVNSISRLIDSEQISGVSSYSLSDTLNNMGKLFSVTIGSVDLTPSREGLRFTDKTNAVLDELILAFYASLRSIATKELEDTDSLRGFYRVKRAWKNVFGQKDPLWDDFLTPERVTSDQLIHEIRRDQWGPSHSESNVIDLDTERKYFLITDLPAEKYKRVNSYVTSFMSARDLAYANFLIVDDPSLKTNEWLEKAGTFTSISFQDIISEGKVFRAAERKAAKEAGISLAPAKITYPVLNVKTKKITMVPYNEIEDGVFYLTKKMTGGHAGHTSWDLLHNYGRPGYHYNQSSITTIANHFRVLDKEIKKVVLITGSRTEEAFLTRVKTAVPVKPKFKKLAERATKCVTPDLLAYNNVKNSTWYSKFRMAGLLSKYDEIEDIYIVELLSGSNSLKKQLEVAEAIHRTLNFFSPARMYSVPSLSDYEAGEKVTDKILNKYPLLGSVNYNSADTKKERFAEHSLMYINSVHQMELANA